MDAALFRAKCLNLLLIEVNFLHDNRLVMLSLLTFFIFKLLYRHSDLFKLACIVSSLHCCYKFSLQILDRKLGPTAHSLGEVDFNRLVRLRRVDSKLCVFEISHLAAVSSAIFSYRVAFLNLLRT